MEMIGAKRVTNNRAGGLLEVVSLGLTTSQTTSRVKGSTTKMTSDVASSLNYILDDLEEFKSKKVLRVSNLSSVIQQSINITVVLIPRVCNGSSLTTWGERSPTTQITSWHRSTQRGALVRSGTCQQPRHPTLAQRHNLEKQRGAGSVEKEPST